MTTESHFHGHLAKILIRVQVALTLLLLLAIGGLNFFFPSSYSVKAGIHGVSSILAVIVATFLTHRAYHLIRGVKINFKSLRYWCLGATVLDFLGIVSGNWIYMRYRGADGPRDWILEQVPEFHNVLMEFKEFISIFPFPLMLAVSVLLFYYSDAIYLRRDITQFIGLLLLIAWFFLMLGFVAGLVLAKLHFV